MRFILAILLLQATLGKSPKAQIQVDNTMGDPGEASQYLDINSASLNQVDNAGGETANQYPISERLKTPDIPPATSPLKPLSRNYLMNNEATELSEEQLASEVLATELQTDRQNNIEQVNGIKKVEKIREQNSAFKDTAKFAAAGLLTTIIVSLIVPFAAPKSPPQHLKIAGFYTENSK